MEMNANEAVELAELMYQTEWGDGLPVVPPTREAVQRFVDYVKADPREVLGEIPPMHGKATVEKVAINAVMAGCLPAFMPVVIAALKAMLNPRFNLHGVACTTGPHTPLVIVSGPAAERLNINGGYNCFGQGWRANATIGRAVKFLIWHLGGARPGVQSKSCMGHPGRYTYCVAENQEANPWDPLHVDLGYAAGDSVVTVFACEAPNNILFFEKQPRPLLAAYADRMSAIGLAQMRVLAGDIFIVVGPEHAKVLARDGWSKRDIRQFLFERARRQIRELHHEETWKRWPRWIDADDPEARIPVVRRPEDIYLLVAGGGGGFHSAILPGWGSRAASERIRFPDQEEGNP
jgi:hypothetical protein